MPTWLIPTLKWGGLALAVIFAIVLLGGERFLPAPPAEGAGGIDAGTLIILYWVLLVVGVVAAGAGFFLDRRPSAPPPPSE